MPASDVRKHTSRLSVGQKERHNHASEKRAGDTSENRIMDGNAGKTCDHKIGAEIGSEREQCLSQLGSRQFGKRQYFRQDAVS
jgi:hypothetical protein